MVELETINLLVQIVGVSAAAIAAVIGVRSYINSNKRAEEAKRKEQETRDRELETRQTQLFMQVFERYHETEFWNIYTTVMNKEWKSYEDWNRDRSDPTSLSMRLAVGTYFEGIGTLVRRGLLPPELVAEILGSIVIMWWDKQSEFYKEFRVKAGYQNYGEHVEYLYNEMKKFRPADFSPSLRT